MRAVLLTGHGGFERLEYREDVPVPVPAAGEVLVRVRAAAVNNTDINARTAWYSKTVRAATDGHNLQANACRVSSPLSDIELASFPCSYTAAENMLARAAVGPQQTVLITGASGGVGSAAVQLARRRGASIIAITSNDKSAALRALGASRVLPRDANLLAELCAESVDAVIDCVGGAQFSSCLQILRRTGRYAVAGAIAGPIVELDLRTLYLKDLTLSGCTIPANGLFADLIGYIERGEIRPLVAKTCALRDLAAAQQEFLSKQHVGKIVLSVAPASPAI